MSDERVQPSFSIIVPTYNRPAQLPTCLAALAQQEYPKDRFEIIVVDDGGASDLNPLVESFKSSVNIKLLRQANSGPAEARNTGVSAAVHEFLAFTDDDCIPAHDWLTRLADAVSAHPDALIGGNCINALRGNSCAEASQTIIEVIHAHFNRDHQNAIFFPSNNIAVSRRKYLEIGGFDAAFRCAEDRDFCDRWRASGARLVFAPQIVMDHAHEMGLRGFFRQHFSYGRGAWRFHHARRVRQTGKLEIEGSFYLKCIAQPLKTHSLFRALPIVALLGVWQVANTAGFFYEAIKSPRQARPAAVRESE